MEIIIKLSAKELSEIIGSEFGPRLLDKISGEYTNVVKVDSEFENCEYKISESERKTALVDDMSWVSFYIYDFILLNYTDESDEFLMIEESVIRKDQGFNVGMIVGGCTQISNRHQLPAFLKIFRPEKTKKLIGANKYYIEAFQNYKQEYLTNYQSEMKARNIELPNMNADE